MRSTFLSASARAVACAVLLGGVATTAAAQDQAPVSSALYYEIGASSVTAGALNPLAINRPQSPGAALPNVCTIWENRHQLERVFGQLVEHYLGEELDAEGLSEQIITGIKTAPQVLLIAALQRALPGFYDFSQNLKSQIDFKIDNAELSCQRAIDRVEEGTHPLDGWITIATSHAWRETLAEDYISTRPDTEKHLLAAEDTVLANARSTPITWFGGGKGVSNEDPIKFVHDVVSAGYAALAGAATTSFNGTDAITAPEQVNLTRLSGSGTAVEEAAVDTRISELWPSSAEAAAFAVSVLGEETIAYCEVDCTSSFQPGLGLMHDYEDELKTLLTAWSGLIQTHEGVTTRPSISALDAISSRTNRVTKGLFEAALGRDGQDRLVFVSRLASDVAVERTVNKALALRQIVRAGRNTPEVRGLGVAREKTAELHDQIRAEVDDLKWEIEQQNYLVSKTATSLLAAEAIEDLVRGDGSLGVESPSGGTRLDRDRVVPKPPEGAGTPGETSSDS